MWCEVELWNWSEFTGDTNGFEYCTLEAGTYDLNAMTAAGCANNSVNSIRVIGHGGNDACCLVAYENWDFTGWAIEFPNGEYTIEDVRARGAVENDLSVTIIYEDGCPSENLEE